MNSDNLLALMLFERYIPVLGESELEQLRAGRVDWDRITIATWEMKLQKLEKRQTATRERVRAAMARSARGGTCKATRKG